MARDVCDVILSMLRANKLMYALSIRLGKSPGRVLGRCGRIESPRRYSKLRRRGRISAHEAPNPNARLPRERRDTGHSTEMLPCLAAKRRSPLPNTDVISITPVAATRAWQHARQQVSRPRAWQWRGSLGTPWYDSSESMARCAAEAPYSWMGPPMRSRRPTPAPGSSGPSAPQPARGRVAL